jgi:hypothetical protein
MILTEKEIDDFRAGRFAIDFPNASLRQRGNVVAPEEISGPGTLRQGAEGRLTLNIYGKRKGASVARSLGRKPGSWVEEHEYHDFVGRDFAGRTWTAEWLHVSTQAESASDAVVCSADVREAQCAREYSRELQNMLWAWFPGSFRLPVNTYTITQRTVGAHTTEGAEPNVWEFTLAGRSVLMSRHENAIEVEVASDEPIPTAYHTRIQEALWLVIARRIEPAIVVLQDGRQVRARLIPTRESAEQPRLQPPLDLRDPEYAGAAADLVNAYIRATSSHESDDRYFHPLGVSISKVLQASQVDVETEALVLSTTVEGLAHDFFLHLGGPDEDLVGGVNLVLESLPEDLDANPFKERIVNALTNVTGRSARSALRSLATAGVITPEQFRAWNIIRHRVAHGRRRTHPPRAFGELCNTIHTALYRILFEIIKYSGPYRDFGTLGWPTVRYDQVNVRADSAQ